MGSRRVTGRFAWFAAAFVATIVLLFRVCSCGGGTRLAVVEAGATSETKRFQAVFVRNEAVGSVGGNDTVYYLAEEGATVAEGDEIIEAYAPGYSIKEINNLEKIRQDIRSHHMAILDNIVDAELDRLNGNVGLRALELKSLVNGEAEGNFANALSRLDESMRLRQSYLSQNRREDSRLTMLYDEEIKLSSRIANWRQAHEAERAGVVSFYMDGNEQTLSPDRLDSLNAATLRAAINGRALDDEASSRQTRPAYRLVDPAHWHLILIVRTGEVDFADGQPVRFQIEGFPDVIHAASVDGVFPDGRDTLIALRVNDPMGPFLYQRSGWAVIGVEYEGLRVPEGAIVYQHDQPGVMRYDGAAGAYVPVQVLARGGGYALVRPIGEGLLWQGATVTY